MRTNAKLLAKQLALAALVLAPIAARAQALSEADVSITLKGFKDDLIAPGQTKTYTLTVTNGGPSTALDIEIAKPVLDEKFTTAPTVTLDGAAVPYKGPLGIVAVDGCILKAVDCTGAAAPSPLCTKAGEKVIDPNSADSWPCTIPSLSDVAADDANVKTVTFDVHWPAAPDDPGTPDVREDLPATCPATDPAYAFTATEVSVTTAGTTDTTPDTATHTPKAAPVADLTFDLVTDQSRVDSGGTFKVDGTVKNLGPCDVTDPKVKDDGGTDTTLTLVPGQTTGCAAIPDDPTTTDVNEAVAAENVNPASDSCTLPALAKDASATFSAVYQTGPMLSDELKRGSTVSLAVADASKTAGVKTVDPDTSNNSGAVTVTSKQSVGSCATGGIPGVLGLLLVAMPLIRRRRSR